LKDGSKWKVRDTVLHDNFAGQPDQQAHWIWDRGDVSRDRSFFDYWFHQIKMPQLDEWVKHTNVALREKKQSATNRGEFIKYLGIRLAAVLERRRGGVPQLFKTRGSSVSSSPSGSKAPDEGTISEGGDYYNRFGMTEDRFTKLTTYLRLTEPQQNTVDKVYYESRCIHRPLINQSYNSFIIH
jgi:hypothetical protein